MDFETKINKTITIRGKELNKYKKQANKELSKLSQSDSRYLNIPIKETGLYRLLKVVDESELEVRRRQADTLVVACPSAVMNAVAPDRCTNELSNFEMVVHGVPPLKLKYSKIVNRKESGHTSLTINLPNFVTPLDGETALNALVALDRIPNTDLHWAQNRSVRVPINETLSLSGDWHYAIDEIEDACGNTIVYYGSQVDDVQRRRSPEGNNLEYHFSVHERPRAELHSCDPQHEIKVQEGEKKQLPVRITCVAEPAVHDSMYHLSYIFTPVNEIKQNQEHRVQPLTVDFSIGRASQAFEVSEPGLYTLISVKSEFCTGEIMEPSTCLLVNPPEPDLVLKDTVIPGRCDGKSVGLSVDLEMMGTPPFRVGYSIQRDEGGITRYTEKSDRLHSHMELRPSIAGHYTYHFDTVSDAVYKKPRTLGNGGITLKQHIIPPTSARFIDSGSYRKVCIGTSASFEIEILGEAHPFALEYEVLHNGGSRKAERKTIGGIKHQVHTITTDDLMEGGEYTVALISVTDGTGCKTPLLDEAKVDVALQRPKAAFGQLEGKRTLMALEGRRIDLPLRLQGSAPWLLSYHNSNAGKADQISVYHSNDKLTISEEGTYELTSVDDVVCPGSVETSASRFVVQWIPRPTMTISESGTVKRISVESENPDYIRNAVCEGDEDATDIGFTGTPPFSLTYDQRHTPSRGPRSSISRSINAGIHAATIRMETSDAGNYEYEFSRLGDYSYNHDPQKFRPMTLKQQVYSRPSARFAAAGKTYKYCKEEQPGEEFVPITLQGRSPFDMEIEIKHHAMRKPENLKLRNIEVDSDTKKRKEYMFQIPHKLLALGNHAVTIRKVTDANGCQRVMEDDAPHVQVSVADVPTITPLEARTDYCVGDRIAYTLAGTPPFNVYYTFQGHDRKASAPTTNFRRLAEKPGEFTINALSDQRSTDACKAKVHLTNLIHEMPSVRVSKGRTATTDIHEGGEAEILFEFGGIPPFEFM